MRCMIAPRAIERNSIILFYFVEGITLHKRCCCGQTHATFRHTKIILNLKKHIFSVVPFCIFTLFSQFLSFRFKFQDRRRSHKLQKYADDLHFHFMVFILIFFFFSRCRSFLTTTTTTCPATTNFIR